MLSKDEAYRELLRRIQRDEQDKAKQHAYLAECFDLQRAVVDDPADEISVRCGRRSGKTSALARRLIKKAQKHSKAKAAYYALSKPHAIRLMWDPLQEIAAKHQLGIEFNQQKHEAYLPNGGQIWIMGADKKEEREKARGFAFEEVQFDEAGSFGPYLKYLREEVLEAALGDYGGSLVMAGTPNASAAGDFRDFDDSPSVSHHHWTVTQNPMFPRWAGAPDWEEKALAFVEERRQKTQKTKFAREWLGLWMRDAASLLYDIDRKRNVFDTLPSDQTFQYVIGCDTGWVDSSALVVLACSNETNQVYQVDAFSRSGIHIDEFAAEIKRYRDLYKPVAIVIDPANKQMVEFIRARFAIGLIDAEKMGKRTFIDFLNAAIYQGAFKFMVGSPVTAQMELLEWNKDRSREAEGFQCDLADCCLYAYRHAYNFLNAREVDDKTPVNPQERARLEGERIRAARLQKMRRQNSGDPLEHEDVPEPDHVGD